MLNSSGHAQEVHLDLLCLGVHVGEFGNGGSVINCAWVHGDEPDDVIGNNRSCYVLEDPPGGSGGSGGSGDPSTPSGPSASGASQASGAALLKPRAVVVSISCKGTGTCSDSVKATAVVKKKHKGHKTVGLGRRSFQVPAGGTTDVKFRINRHKHHQLATKRFRYVKLKLRGGDSAKLKVRRRH